MKKLFRPLLWLGAIALASIPLLMLTGCGFESSFIKSTPVLVKPASTNTVFQVQTNFLTVTNFQTNVVTVVQAATNTQTGVVTPAVVQPQILPVITVSAQITTNVTTVYSPPIYYTNLDLTPLVTNGVAQAGNVAGAMGVPFASTASAGLLALSTLVLGFFNNRNKKKAEAEAANHATTQGILDTTQTVAETLVENFEQLRQVALTIPGYTPEMDHKVMDAVKTAQAVAGVKSEIHDIVEDKTNDTVPNK